MLTALSLRRNVRCMETDPRNLVRPLALNAELLHRYLRHRVGPPPSTAGRLCAEAISTLHRCEVLARSLYSSDPAGL